MLEIRSAEYFYIVASFGRIVLFRAVKFETYLSDNHFLSNVFSQAFICCHLCTVAFQENHWMQKKASQSPYLLCGRGMDRN